MFFPPTRLKRCPYCNENLKKNIYCRAQDEYDGFGENLSPMEYRNICGEELRETERKILENYADGSVFEIGCGQFHRTEQFYLEKNIQFYGIDPLIQIVHGGKYADRTLIGIFPKDFIPENYNYLSLTHFFGGILNGAICKGFQDQFWMGLELLGQNCKSIAFDSLIHFPEVNFDYVKDEQGQIIQAFHTAPPQYFPSEKELQKRFKDHNFQVIETIDDAMPMAHRRIFIIQYQLK